MQLNGSHLTVLNFPMFHHDIQFLTGPLVDLSEIVIISLDLNIPATSRTGAGLVVDLQEIPDGVSYPQNVQNIVDPFEDLIVSQQ